MSKSSYLRLGLLTFGLGFAEAASRSVHGPRWQQKLSMVGYYFYCHSIEVALKSHLRKSGFSEKQLLDLSNELKLVLENSAETQIDSESLSPELRECIGMMNAYYRENEFEYFSHVMGTRLPDTRQFSKAVKHLRRGLDARYKSRRIKK